MNLQELKAGISKHTIRDQVARRLAEMVQSGLLRMGDELPSERELAATLEVSRETVRGAIQMLGAIGMVEISQGARTRIVRSDGFPYALGGVPLTPTHRSADEVYEARRLVELPIVRQAAERIDAAGISRLRRLVDAQAEMTDDPVRFQISDAEFHDAIYRAAGNELVAEFLRKMYSFALEHRRQALLDAGAVTRSLNDHIRILTGIEAHDPDAAEKAMGEHLDRIHSTTIAVMETV